MFFHVIERQTGKLIATWLPEPVAFEYDKRRYKLIDSMQPRKVIKPLGYMYLERRHHFGIPCEPYMEKCAFYSIKDFIRS